MTTTRIRRIVKCVLLGVAAIVLLLIGYVGAWLGVSLAWQHRLIRGWVVEKSIPVFTPLVNYSNSGLPGGDSLARLWYDVNTLDGGKVSISINGRYIAPDARRGGQLRVRLPRR